MHRHGSVWGQRLLGGMPPYEARWVELWGGVTACLWALYLALMPSAFADIAQWQPVARIGTNCEWAGAFAVTGGLQVAFARVNRKWPRFILASLMVWGYVALFDGLWMARTAPGPSIVLYVGWAFANLVSVVLVLQIRR